MHFTRYLGSKIAAWPLMVWYREVDVERARRLQARKAAEIARMEAESDEDSDEGDGSDPFGGPNGYC